MGKELTASAVFSSIAGQCAPVASTRRDEIDGEFEMVAFDILKMQLYMVFWLLPQFIQGSFILKYRQFIEYASALVIL